MRSDTPHTAINSPGAVTVYSGLDATGDVLGVLDLTLTPTNCSGDPAGQFCTFVPVGVSFSGVAHSVNFGGVANQIGVDNITLGASVPTGAVPEPGTWMMMLLGFGAIGLAVRRRSRQLAIA